MAKNTMTREQRRDAAQTVRAGTVSGERMVDQNGNLMRLTDDEWADLNYLDRHGRLPAGSSLRSASELRRLRDSRVPAWVIDEVAELQARRAGRPVPTAAGAVEVENDEEDQEEGQEEELAEGEAEIEDDELDPLASALRDLPMPETVLEELELPAVGASAHQRAAHERNQALRLCLELDGRRIAMEDERMLLRQANVAAMAEVGGEQHDAALEELATVGLSRQARQAGIELALRGLWSKRAGAQAAFVQANRAMVEADQAKKLAAAKAKLGRMLRMWHEFRALGFELRADLVDLAETRGRKGMLDLMSLLGPVLWRDLVEAGYGRCEPTITDWGMPDADQVDQRCAAVLNDLGNRQAQRTCDLVEERAGAAWLVVPDQQSWLATLTSPAYRHGRGEVERKRSERSPPPKEAA